MARSVTGIFAERASAERAIEDLKAAGFDPGRIGVVMQDKQQAQDVATEHGTAAGEGAMAGGLLGGGIGAVLAATGSLVIPGIGPFIAGGILATAIAGAAAGGIIGALVGLGIPKEEAAYYQERVQQGHVLVTVEAPGREAEARAILLRNGAEDLQAQGYGGGDDTPAPRTAPAPLPASTTSTGGEDIRVPVREEELIVGKQQDEVGRVHLHTDVIAEQQTITAPVTHDEVRVERVPVQDPYSGDVSAEVFTEKDIDVPVMGEELVAGKRTVVNEEVRLSKQAVTEDQQVTETVRKERVTVDGVEETRGAAAEPAGRNDRPQ